MTDHELLERARAGDTEAFGELVNRHRQAMLRAALAALGSPPDADDAVQEACVAAWRECGGFRGDAGPRTWLLAIVWRKAIDRRRSRNRWWRRLPGSNVARLVDSDAQERWRIAEGPTPEQATVDRERARLVRSAIVQLPAPLRDALLLAASGVYRYEEIGAMLNAPVGTIKWRVSEARRRVRAHLRAIGVGDV